MNNKDYLKDFDLRNFADPKNNLNQIIKDFDKYRYLNEVKKDALKQEPNFIEKSINKLFEFINFLVFKKDQFVGAVEVKINKVVVFKDNQIEVLNAYGLRLTKSFEELVFRFVNFRKNYRERAFKASSDSFVLINSAVEKSDYIYSQSVTTLKKVVPSSPQTILRAAAVFGLVTALILPSSNFAAFAEESLPETTTSEAVPEEAPVSEPSPEVSASPESSPEAIEVGSEVIVEPTKTTEPSPSVEPEVSPTPEVSPSIEVSPSPSPSVLIINAPTNLNYTPVVEGVKLTWDKTDSEIDKYIVKVDPDGRQIDVAKDSTELLLADLDRKATYSFSVWAVSGELSSEVASLSVDLATVKFPRPPMNAEVGGLIVKFEDQPLSSEEVVAIADTTQLTPVSMEVSSEISTDTHLVEFAQPVDVATANEIADALEANNNIEYAELDFAFVTASDVSFVPNDPLYASKQWSLWGNFGVGIADGPTGLALAYQNSTGLGSVVAVIDTGFTNHPDLEGQFVSGYDFVSNNEMLSGVREENGNPVPYDGDYIDTNTYGPIGWDDNPLDPGDWRNGNNSSWHGTYIAGLIAAKTNNGIGIAGIAPDAKIQPIRAFSWRGGLLSDVIASITWASGGTVETVPANQTPAKVINLSFSVEAPCTPSLQTAIDEAIERGSVVVAAAGNNNSDAANFAPGNCQNVITVGAIDSDGNRANYSNFGSTIDISAPGGEIEGNAIYSTSNEGTTTSTNPAYVVRQGTSIATAQVSAALAKLAQTYPTENATELKARVLSKEQTKPFQSGLCLNDKNCGVGYLFLKINTLPGARTGTNSNNELFLGGNYIELGISRKGNFGTSTGGGKPAGFNGAASRNYIGMSADHDGFGVGTDNKNMDYFLPGTPEERFAYGYKVGGTTTTRSNSELGSGANNEPTTLTNTSTGDTLSATILTTWSSVMTIQQKIQFNVNDKFFRNEVTITNISGATMDSARFMRSFDPDNTVDSGVGSGYTTRNTINFQQPGDSKAQVTAESTSSFVIGSRASSTYPIVFYSTDTDARVATWGFANSNPYTTSAYESAGAKNYTVDADQAITITWQTTNLANNASDSFVYYTSLDQRDFASVVAEVQAAEAAALAPSKPTLQNGIGQLTASWNAPSTSETITDYNIQYSTDGTNWTTFSDGTSTSTTATITGLNSGTSYFVRVRAVTSPSGAGNWSEASLGSTPNTPNAPTIDSISASDKSLSVSFTAPTSYSSMQPITDYEYSTDDGSTYRLVGATTSPIVITKLSSDGTTDLTNGTSYTIRIRAVNSVGSGKFASTSGTPVTTAGAPTISSITAGNGQLSVAFNAPASNGGASITTYKYSIDDGATFTTRSSGTTASPLVITGLTNGTSYNVKVLAVNSQGDGAESNSVSATPRTTPSSPSISSITGANQSLTINFSQSSTGGSAITNYKYSINGGSFTALSPAQTTSPLTISGLINGTSYTIQIRAVNVAGDSSSSNSVSGTPEAPASGSNPTPTPSATPISTPRPSPRPTNLITNPLITPTQIPTPSPTPTIVPGTVTKPEPLIKKLIEELISPLKPRIIDLFTSPTPRSTNVTSTNTSVPVPAPTFDNQKALEIAPQTQDKKVVELPSLVLVNEVPEPSKVVVVENTIAQIVTPGGGLLNVEAKDGENSIPVDNRGRVQMVRENNVETEGKGMAPNSEFAVYLFSDPILLGIGKTNAKGEFFASFPVEDQLPIGDHTLQVNGLLPDGKTASISMPVTVVDSIETAKNQAMPKTIFVSENPVDKALKALYWMLIVLAVMMFLIAAANRKRFFALFRRRDDEEEPQTI